MDRIISMIINRLIRRTVTRGVDAGIDMAMRGRGEQADRPDERQGAQRNSQGLRQMTRVARRFTRF